MKMGTIRQSVMKRLSMKDHNACRISSKDCHMYSTITHNFNRQLSLPILFPVIGPFYFRKTTYQVTVHSSALGNGTPEQYDEKRFDVLKTARMQVVPFLPVSTRLLQLLGHFLNFTCPHSRRAVLLPEHAQQRQKRAFGPSSSPQSTSR
jgi:hypothetical protein